MWECVLLYGANNITDCSSSMIKWLVIDKLEETWKEWLWPEQGRPTIPVFSSKFWDKSRHTAVMSMILMRLLKSDTAVSDNLFFLVVRVLENTEIIKVYGYRHWYCRPAMGAVSWFRRLIAGLSPQRFRLWSRPVRVSSVMDKEALGHVVLRLNYLDSPLTACFLR